MQDKITNNKTVRFSPMLKGLNIKEVNAYGIL